jgi:hypothetical protein
LKEILVVQLQEGKPDEHNVLCNPLDDRAKQSHNSLFVLLKEILGDLQE